MEVLRIATAGSVDDGKSTLIGRLLYDTHSIPQDKLAAIEQASKRKGLGFIDLSLLTDGLIAEREQGITIDVAHIYFSTLRRKYIIADTPGHFEYTRNMVTGASNASVSLILIDARNGVTEQTHRHFYIASLLRIPKVLVCVNKMDLVNYSETRFNQIVEDFQQVAAKISSKLKVTGKSEQPLNLTGQEITFIPISSLYGENVVNRSEAIPWYNGKSLLEYLESVELTAGL
ncbi:MAG TPA: GTP-binding protein, partial [Chitinophagaceae bacterium]